MKLPIYKPEAIKSTSNPMEERITKLEERIASLEFTLQKYFEDKPDSLDNSSSDEPPF